MEPGLLAIILIGGSIVGLGLIILIAFRGNPTPATEAEGSGAVTPGQTIGLGESEKVSAKEKLKERLVQAGLYKNNSTSFYYFAQLAFVIAPLAIGFICYNAGIISLVNAAGLALIFGIAGVIGPGLWLDYLKAKRQTSIRRAIPDALDVITICVDAGLSLNAAIVRVSKDLSRTYPLLASELTIVHRHVQMGKSLGEALRSFSERFDLAELRSLSSVVQQSEKFGASIASALRVHADSLRTKRMQKAQEKAQKAAVWILFPTVICIFPSLFVVILGPAAFDILELLDEVAS